MRTPWKVVSELVFGRDRKTDAEGSGAEAAQSAAKTTNPVPTAPQADPAAAHVSNETPVADHDGGATAPAGPGVDPGASRPSNASPLNDKGDHQPALSGRVSSRRQVSTETPTRSPPGVRAGDRQARKTRSDSDVARSKRESAKTGLHSPAPRIIDDAATLDAAIQDLRARLSERLAAQNLLLRDLLKRYD